MRITLTFPHTFDSERMGAKSFPPTSVYHLASILRNNGHSVKVFDPAWPNQYDSTLVNEAIDGCDLLGISTNVINWRFAKQFAALVKLQNENVRVVIGGVYAGVIGKAHFDSHPWDFVVRGDGEETLLELTEAIDKSAGFGGILGLSYFDSSGSLRVNADRPPLAAGELSRQPVPAFDLLPDQKYLALGVESSRGCIHKCLFCSIPFRRSFRAIDEEVFLSRVRETYDLSHNRVRLPYGDKTPIMLLDDCFTTQQNRAARILEGLAVFNDRMRFGVEVRADQFSERIAEAMAKNALFIIQMGMELGYQEGLDMINKGLKIDEIERACLTLKRYDLAKVSSCSFILGLPWEKKIDCLKTLRFAEHLVSKYSVNVGLTWHELYPGSVMWERKHEFGIDANLSLYDDFDYDFRNDIALFRRVHPLLSSKDIDEIEKHVFEISQVSSRSLINFPYVQRERNMSSPPF